MNTVDMAILREFWRYAHIMELDVSKDDEYASAVALFTEQYPLTIDWFRGN